MKNYELTVISHHPRFKNQALIPYYVDGIDTIGVWGQEAFGLKFTNNTDKSVQVRLSLDGTDILTGKLATTEASGKMFLVAAHSSLHVEAWPETMEGGARFVFGNVENSVAIHTHGNLANKGIIAASVYEESYSPKAYVTKSHIPYGRMDLQPYPFVDLFGSWVSPIHLESRSVEINKGQCMIGPAVGAGETVKQALKEVEGLHNLRFALNLRMRYVWYDDLKEKINKFTQSRSLINLGNTPRLGDRTKVVDAKPVEIQRTI